MRDTLKSICEQCTHLNNPHLDFIPHEFERHKGIVLRDLRELTDAASFELYKSVLALTGSIAEALLFTFLKPQESLISAKRGRAFVLDPGETLQTFVNVFNRYFADRFPEDLLPDDVVSYRDLIHVNREASSDPDFIREAAPNMLRILNGLVGEFTKGTRAHTA